MDCTLLVWCNENIGFITFLSVLATLVICIYNHKALKEAQKQRDISEAQFNKNLRNQYLPYLNVELEETKLDHVELPNIWLNTNAGLDGNKSNCYKFTIKNVGTGMLTNLNTYWINEADNRDSIINREYKPISCALLLKDEMFEFKAIILGDFKDKLVRSNGIMHFEYQDQLENMYYQDVLVDYDITKEKVFVPSIEIKHPKPVKWFYDEIRELIDYDDKSR